MSTTPQQYFLQVFFIPITLYFDITFAKRLLNKNPQANNQELDIFQKKSYKRYLLMFALLLALTIFAISNIIKNSGQ